MGWMFLPLRRYVDFSGRSRRVEFWMFFLLNLIAIALAALWFYRGLIRIGMAGETGHAIDDAVGYLNGSLGFLGLFVVVTFIPALALQVRRFHDQDLSGLLVLLNLVPAVGSLAVLVFMCLKGTVGENRFGPDPRMPGRDRTTL